MPQHREITAEVFQSKSQVWNKRTQFKSGTVTFTSTQQTQIVTLGFKPKYIAVLYNGQSSSPSSVKAGAHRVIYNSDYSESYYVNDYQSTQNKYITVGEVSNLAITNTSFSLTLGSIAAGVGTWYYFAVGWLLQTTDFCGPAICIWGASKLQCCVVYVFNATDTVSSIKRTKGH